MTRKTEVFGGFNTQEEGRLVVERYSLLDKMFELVPGDFMC